MYPHKLCTDFGAEGGSKLRDQNVAFATTTPWEAAGHPQESGGVQGSLQHHNHCDAVRASPVPAPFPQVLAAVPMPEWDLGNHCFNSLLVSCE